MEEPKRETGPTPEEQRLQESPAEKPASGEVRLSPGRLPEKFRKLSETHEGRRALVKRVAASGRTENVKPGRPVPEEFWRSPKPKDPEGLAPRCLLEGRRQGR